MRLKFKKFALVSLVVMSLGLVFGCCENPNAFKVAMSATNTVQTVYDPLVSGYLSDQTNQTVKAGVLAADTLLALAGQIQASTCATAEQAAQMQAQAAEIKRVADGIGVQ